MSEPTFLANLGMQAASQAQQGLFGLALGGINDKRQLKQQKKLMALQLQGNKEMTDYQMQKELAMWKATNYSAQKEEMKKAGLNPALLYGMSGGGGITVGGSGHSVSGGQAPAGGGEIQALMTGMGLQMAQRDLIRAQTEQVKAETEKTKGVDTEKTQMETRSLAQGINNQKSAQKLTELQSELAEIEKDFQENTLNDRITHIKYIVSKTYKELQLLTNEQVISDATLNDKIKLVKTEAINAILTNALIKAETANINKDTQKKEAEIGKIKSEENLNYRMVQKWVWDNAIDWRNLSVSERNAAVNELIGDFKVYDEPTLNIIRSSIDEILSGRIRK